MRWWQVAAVGVWILVLTSSVAAFEGNLEASGWEVMGIPGQSETTFQVTEKRVLSVRSDNSVAFLYKRVDHAEDRLEWCWRIDEMGVPSDLAQVREDDRPIAVHLWFPEQGGQNSLFGGLAELLGFPRVGNALTYVWGGGDHGARISPNPHLPDGQGAIIVLRTQSAQTATWVCEIVEYKADFLSAFEKPAPRPTYIAISGDSDDLGGVRRASITDLRFVPQSDQ